MIRQAIALDGGRMPDELMSMSASDQAAAVRSGDVSAVELVEASLAQIDRLNGELNAVITPVEDRARAEAQHVTQGDDRPLAGVPIVVKDLLQLTEGVRTTFGSAAVGDFVPRFDTALVRKLRAAGAILVGKTNTPEFGILPTTEPHRFGPTRNPWDTSRTSGGSSGGTAAAVAAGMVAFGHGNDGGGSIRIPASCCGLVGLKPSRGRISLAPLVPQPAMLSTDGFLTWTVADTALGMDIGAGYEWGDLAWPPPPSAPFADAVTREPGRLRIGFTTLAPNDADVHPDCVAATEEAAKLLESLGHDVEEGAPDWNAEAFIETFTSLWIGEHGSGVAGTGSLVGHPLDPDLLEPLSREMLEVARGMTAIDGYRALVAIRAYSRRVVGWWADHDVLVTPTLAQPPMPLGWLEPDPGEPALQMLDKSAGFVPFTPPLNASGQPAISLPLHQSAGGLPIGVQLVGPPAGEELLLSLAGQLERAAPWADRRPDFAAVSGH
jgi:amidase